MRSVESCCKEAPIQTTTQPHYKIQPTTTYSTIFNTPTTLVSTYPLHLAIVEGPAGRSRCALGCGRNKSSIFQKHVQHVVLKNAIKLVLSGVGA